MSYSSLLINMLVSLGWSLDKANSFLSPFASPLPDSVDMSLSSFLSLSLSCPQTDMHAFRKTNGKNSIKFRNESNLGE